MSLTSELLASDELFELNEMGIISSIEKKIKFINLFEMSRSSIASGYEKKLINEAKKEFNTILNMIKISEVIFPLSEEECEKIMDKIYDIINNIIDFTEFEFLN
ncbi:MAG: hypothetical protein ACFFBP_17330 [Promethearchaeota archaeon]